MDDAHNKGESLRIERVDGNAVFVVAAQEPGEIPEGAGRECPQCLKTAWAKSRFCWHCRFDFDRAALPRIHQTKLLWLSLLLNAVTALSVGWLAVSSFLTGQ